MTLLVPNAGEGRMLNNILNKVAPQDQRLKLYQNNTRPPKPTPRPPTQSRPGRATLTRRSPRPTGR